MLIEATNIIRARVFPDSMSCREYHVVVLTGCMLPRSTQQAALAWRPHHAKACQATAGKSRTHNVATTA